MPVLARVWDSEEAWVLDLQEVWAVGYSAEEAAGVFLRIMGQMRRHSQCQTKKF